MRNPKPQSTRLVTTITLACLFLSAGTALAQDRVALLGHAGIAIPAGALSKMEGMGASVGGGIGVRVHPDVALRLGLDADILEGKRLRSGEDAPGVNLYHFLLGAEWVLSSEDVPLVASATLGAGRTILEVEAFSVPQTQPGAGQTPLIREGYVSVHAGAQLAYRPGRRVELALAARAFRVFADEAETAAVATLSEEVEPLGAVWTFPVTLRMNLWLF